MVISNCVITKQTSQVIEGCTTNQSHIGIDISGDSIYTAYDGTVVVANQGHLGHSVIIQTGMSFCVVYGHLASMNVHAGQYVAAGELIGVADRYVHLELLRLTQSAWPVRIGATTWYKADPSNIFTDTLSAANEHSFDTLNIREISNYPSGKTVEVSGYSKFILSNNKGE